MSAKLQLVGEYRDAVSRNSVVIETAKYHIDGAESYEVSATVFTKSRIVTLIIPFKFGPGDLSPLFMVSAAQVIARIAKHVTEHAHDGGLTLPYDLVSVSSVITGPRAETTYNLVLTDYATRESVEIARGLSANQTLTLDGQRDAGVCWSWEEVGLDIADSVIEFYYETRGTVPAA